MVISRKKLNSTMRPACWVMAVVVGLHSAAATVFAEPSVNDMIRDLTGRDGRARCTARQMLPRQSIEIVPKLVPLVAQENDLVWRPAFNVLADFANEVSVPGREEDRKAVASCLMTLISPAQTEAVRIRGLRLLPLVIPTGFDISPLVTLLDDPNLQEKARAALQEMGTVEARAALRSYLSKATPDFACALLDSLGQLHDGSSIEAILEMVGHQQPKVRAAAARALSWTGDPKMIKAIEQVLDAADDATRRDAADAALRMADALAAKADQRSLAYDLYHRLLDTVDSTVLRSAAIVGLGKSGDEKAVPEILAIIKKDNGREYESAALAAFGALRDPAAHQAMLDAYPSLPADMRMGMLSVFGRKGDTLFTNLLLEVARNGEQEQRQAALNALVDSRMPEAMTGLSEMASKVTGDDKTAILAAMKQFAEDFRQRNDRVRTGQAFMSLYQAADSVDLRRFALEGIKQYPGREVIGLVKKAVETPELSDLATNVLATLTRDAADAGRNQEADELIAFLTSRVKTTDALKELIAVVRTRHKNEEMAPKLGFIMSWKLVGPFPWSSDQAFRKINVNEPNVDPQAKYRIGDKDVGWITHKSRDAAGIVDLLGVFGRQNNVTCYALAEIEVTEATDAFVFMGSDDGIKLWVNGDAVHENNVGRGLDIDQDRVAVKLKAGKNVFLAEITQSVLGWSFCIRVAKPDHTPMALPVIP